MKKGGKKFKSPSKKEAIKSSFKRSANPHMSSDEGKYTENSLAMNCDTTGSVQSMSFVAQGTTVTTRIGRKYRLRNFQLRGAIVQGTTAIQNVYALYLVWDAQPDGSAIAVTDLLASASSYALTNRDNSSRLKILKKWTGVLASSGAGTGQADNVAVRIDEFFKLPDDCIVQYTAADTTGSVANLITGALYLVSVGNVAAGTAACTFTGNFRTAFEDL
jgi:hypothetical protein